MNKNILYKALNSEDTPNLLIYPNYGETLFYKLFYEIHKINLKKSNKITVNELSYIINDFYYEFDIKNITSKNLDKFTQILKEIIIRPNLYSYKNRVIILKNFNNVKYNLQNILRVVIEKYRKTTIFIVLSKKYDNIIEPLRSRFLCLRIPQPPKKEKRKIIFNNDKNLKHDKFYDYIYSLENKKDIKSIINYENEIIKFNEPYEIICKKIEKIYSKKNINISDFKNLREISYNILKFNIDINKFYKIYLNNILTNKFIRDKTKYKIVKLFAKSQYDFTNSFRSSIILESLMINSCYEITTDHLSYLL